MTDTSQLYFTWNLFVAPLVSIGGVGLTVWIIKGYVTKLGSDAEDRYKGYKTTLDTIQSCVTTIKVGMERKVDRKEHDEHCLKTVDDVWDRVNKHSHVLDIPNNKATQVIIES